MSEEKKNTPKPDAPKPWPISWIVIAILLYAVIHTTVILLG